MITPALKEVAELRGIDALAARCRWTDGPDLRGCRAGVGAWVRWRGSQAFAPNAPDCCTSWGGFYVGGQVGFGVTSADFSTTTQDLVAHELRQLALEAEQSVSSWQVLGQAHPSSATYGFFVGYNIPWESLILGAEAN